MKTRIVLALIGAVILGSPFPQVQAQTQAPYNKEDPCYKTWDAYLNLPADEANWQNGVLLSNLATEIRRDLRALHARIVKIDAEWSKTPAAKQAELVAELERIIECVPRLEEWLKVLEDQLKRLGVQSILLEPAGRERVPVAAFSMKVRGEANETKIRIEAILGRRG